MGEVQRNAVIECPRLREISLEVRLPGGAVGPGMTRYALSSDPSKTADFEDRYLVPAKSAERVFIYLENVLQHNIPEIANARKGQRIC